MSQTSQRFDFEVSDQSKTRGNNRGENNGRKSMVQYGISTTSAGMGTSAVLSQNNEERSRTP